MFDVTVRLSIGSTHTRIDKAQGWVGGWVGECAVYARTHTHGRCGRAALTPRRDVRAPAKMRSVSIALAHSRTVLMTNHKRTFKQLTLALARVRVCVCSA